MKSKVLTIIKILDDLKLICKYFIDFYPNANLEDIYNIRKIIISLEDNNMNYFEIYYKKEYEKYIKYLDEAKNNLGKKIVNFLIKFILIQEQFLKKMI